MEKKYRFFNCEVVVRPTIFGGLWWFTVQQDGGDKLTFKRSPPHSNTARSAMMLGYYRAKWVNDGVHRNKGEEVVPVLDKRNLVDKFWALLTDNEKDQPVPRDRWGSPSNHTVKVAEFQIQIDGDDLFASVGYRYNTGLTGDSGFNFHISKEKYQYTSSLFSLNVDKDVHSNGFTDGFVTPLAMSHKHQWDKNKFETYWAAASKYQDAIVVSRKN